MRVGTLRTTRAVRASVRAFIRRELPEGSAFAFPPEELERLNRARESSQRFAPYDAPLSVE